ncbi:GNAT family N-acetyltransferase [Reinekea marina]|uniref:GNAT family N-acetyltransferase n=1 Tax=Reinekea marina TaxID=1310421 RepID=A0ABV7WWW5_9GAMM|nr:GNAT family N-acetyltransferase [Reinekea marina]MDN3650065.1 GNAT family N-acetyltransferase [Reinekea marina]
MKYQVDSHVGIDEFLSLANSNWPGEYDREKAKAALEKTINLSARDNGSLIGCLRILTDGYFFSTIPEAFVLPEWQGEGIGTKLFELAKEEAPTSLFFGAQPEKEAFYEKLGFEKSLQSFHHKKSRK